MNQYIVNADGVPARIRIVYEKDYVPHYILDRPKIEEATEALLEEIKASLVKEVSISIKEYVDAKELETVKEKFIKKADESIRNFLPNLGESQRRILIGNLIHEMLGLGDLEILLNDPNLEEVVINCSSEPVWVYHKKLGWLKTNIQMKSESEIYNYSSIIGRRVGRQISNLNPLLDAHLPSGDRTNATIFPISTKGNTLTIRKFARSPWTITDFIKNKTINPEVAALIWLCIQYELNVLISGGTGAGKTSLLNVLMPFIPPNQRIVSIEDTREIQLPDFLHWVPLTTRQQNPEGKGKVSMLDLLVNSLRMRPDRIIVGEIRRKRQAEVLFEAMHTGHSVYSTLHADTAQQTIRRLINPPIDVPVSMIDAVDLNIVMFRDRRRNIRRVMEVAEILPEFRGPESEANANIIYRWHPKTDTLKKEGRSVKIFMQLELHTGLSPEEVQEDVKEKVKILNWAVKHDIREINQVGKIIAEYYRDKNLVLDLIEKKKPPEKILHND